MIKSSPDGQHIAAQVYAGLPTASKGTELYDFNAATGTVSNCKVLDTVTAAYGAEFSPDGTKLYCQKWAGNIYQYDITAGSAAAISATRTIVDSGNANSDLKLGPDGKIYYRSPVQDSVLSCFSNPNNAGSGCGRVGRAIVLTGGFHSDFGFPNTFVKDTLHPSAVADIREAGTSIVVFSNPAKNQIFIQGSNLTGNYAEISLYNIAGTLVGSHSEKMATGLLNTSIRLNNFAPGFYFVKIQDETEKSYFRKFVIE